MNEAQLASYMLILRSAVNLPTLRRIEIKTLLEPESVPIIPQSILLSEGVQEPLVLRLPHTASGYQVLRYGFSPAVNIMGELVEISAGLCSVTGTRVLELGTAPYTLNVPSVWLTAPVDRYQPNGPMAEAAFIVVADN